MRPFEAPRLGRRVNVGAGAQILGAVSVGESAQIGANAVVLIDVPAGATAVGVPAVVRSPSSRECAAPPARIGDPACLQPQAGEDRGAGLSATGRGRDRLGEARLELEGDRRRGGEPSHVGRQRIRRSLHVTR